MVEHTRSQHVLPIFSPIIAWATAVMKDKLIVQLLSPLGSPHSSIHFFADSKKGCSLLSQEKLRWFSNLWRRGFLLSRRKSCGSSLSHSAYISRSTVCIIYILCIVGLFVLIVASSQSHSKAMQNKHNMLL